MLDIVALPQDLTPEWMTTALRQAGFIPDGSVRSLDCAIIGNGKMGDNARFSLHYEGEQGDAPDSVVGKFPAQDETARAMAGAQGAYYNEVMFYRQLADRTTMRTPVIYANEIAADRLSFVTLMEDMSPVEPGSQLVGESLERTRVAMGEAAKLAAAFYADQSIGELDFVTASAREDGGAFAQGLLQQYWPGFLAR